MGALGSGPIVVRPGWGGYTYPLPNVVKVQIATRVNPELCTLSEAYQFLGIVLAQGDLIPAGEIPTIREQQQNQLYVDPAYIAAGYLPLVLEWAGKSPSAAARDIPEQGSQTVETPAEPYAYEINIGMMYMSAPQVPGSQSQAFRTDFKLQVEPDGSLIWVGLDQPTYPPPVPAPAA